MSILKIIEESIQVKELLKTKVPQIEHLSKVVKTQLSKGKKILLCGNGGSASDAQHIACEFVGKLKKERKGLPAIALNTNTSILTAISNDYSFEEVFSRQVKAIGEEGDILIAISTSGESPNVLEAVKTAKRMGIYTVGLTGERGRLREEVDLAIEVPSSDTQRIQECHILVGHIICQMVEEGI